MSMGKFDLLADAAQSGSPLRNQAAAYLHAIYGNAEVDQRVAGKKVDVVCQVDDLGRRLPMLVECKDYEGRLTRDQVAHILVDYTDVLAAEPAGTLLIVTRNGLTTDAYALLGSNHRTPYLIWDLEDPVLGIAEYTKVATRTIRAVTGPLDQLMALMEGKTPPG